MRNSEPHRRGILQPRSALMAVAGLFFIVPALTAQAAPVRVEADVRCRGDNDPRRERYCEVREYRLDARPELAVDAGANGGIRIIGWDRDEVLLTARIGASSRDGDPRALADAIEIRTGATIEADGPRTRGRRGWWSVSYELMVPRGTALRLEAHNGGIGLEGLAGDVEARTTNGGITLAGGAGRVRGRTMNGGLRLDLTGRTWEGGGVDLQTTNGGVRIRLPEGYAADLETGTVNGGMQLDIPITVQGRISRRIRTQVGGGGPLIRAVTTNGGIVVGH